MDKHQFDALTKAWGSAANRRRVLGGLLAATGLLGWRHAGAQGGHECADFCRDVFPPGRERAECLRAAAHGAGLCSACGADVKNTCIAADGTVTCCGAGQVCLNGRCANICTGEQAPCSPFTPCGAAGSGCGCYFTVEGPTVCGTRSGCGGPVCSTSLDCDPGFFCSNTCCGLMCMPLCGVTVAAASVSGGGSPDLP